MRLQNNIAVKMKGTYGIKFVMSTGTAKLQQQIGDEGYLDIDDSAKSASSAFNIDVLNCDIKAILTGDAVAYAENIRA